MRFAVLGFAALAAFFAVGAEDPAFTLATFNVRYTAPDDVGDIAWSNRMPRIARIVRDHGFDVFGVQEAMPEEARMLEAGLPGFRHVGCGRDAKRSGEAMLVFYRADRFECLGDDTFWLSETPREPGSKYPGAGCPRTCTWALLKDRVTGRTFRYFNTHLDHMSAAARKDGMRVLLENGLRAAKARGETVVLTGDLNEEPAEDNAIGLVSRELTDAFRVSETPHRGPEKTCHGYRDEPRWRIDYVFVSSDVKVMAHETIADKPDGKFASDHFPVSVRIDIRQPVSGGL